MFHRVISTHRTSEVLSLAKNNASIPFIGGLKRREGKLRRDGLCEVGIESRWRRGLEGEAVQSQMCGDS